MLVEGKVVVAPGAAPSAVTRSAVAFVELVRGEAVDPDRWLAAMRRLDYMVGTWRGEGWIEMQGARHAFHGQETVQRKLRGVALLVEGDFRARFAGAAEEVPVHTTLGVISFDPRAQAYRFDSWLATGGSGRHELQLTTDGWQWEIEHPQGVVRYRASFTPAGEWREIGERSTDRRSWSRFFEMTLTKVP